MPIDYNQQSNPNSDYSSLLDMLGRDREFINTHQQIEPNNRYRRMLQQELAYQAKENGVPDEKLQYLQNPDISNLNTPNTSYSSELIKSLQADILANLKTNNQSLNDASSLADLYDSMYNNTVSRHDAISRGNPVYSVNYGGDLSNSPIQPNNSVNSGSGIYGIRGAVEPVEGDFKITSPVGKRKAFRTSNGKMSSSDHKGTDYVPAKKGTNPQIRSIIDGQVIWVGKANGYGNTVLIRNSNGIVSQYGHLSKANVKVGDTVKAGSYIGVMGSTGNSTGTHLDLVVMNINTGKILDREGKAVYDIPQAMLARIGR